MYTVEQLQKEYKRESDSSSSGFTYYRQSDYAGIGIYCSPFFNCQNFSLADAGSFFERMKNLEVSETVILKFLYSISGRRLLMIDVNDSYVSTIKDLLPTRTYIVDQPYVSTNGSSMHILYFKI